MSLSSQNNTLNGFYDLGVAPLTFDFFTFLVLAELERLKLGLTYLRIIIVPSTPETRDANLKDRFSEAGRAWRLSQIILPACNLMASCGGRVTVLGSREETVGFEVAAGAHIFPRGYHLDAPVACFQLAEVAAMHACGEDIPSISAPQPALELVRQWIAAHAGGKKTVAITLREAPYGQERNSNIEAWGEFSRGLDRERYFPIIVRDTYAVFDAVPWELRDLTIFESASTNLELRLALYEEVYLNLQTNGGPLVLCHLDTRTRCMMFKPMVESWHDSTAYGLERGVGVKIGCQPNFLSSMQRWYWHDDTVEAITKGFDLMTAFIDGEDKDLSAEELAFFAVNDEAPGQLAARLERVDSWAPARIILQYLLRPAPDDPKLNFRLGTCETWLGNFQEAEKRLSIAADSDDSNPAYQLGLGDLSIAQGQAELAMARYRHAINLDENHPRSYVCLGMLLESLGNLEEAEKLLRHAISLAPGIATNLRILSRILEAGGNQTEARQFMSMADEIAPRPDTESL